MKPIFLVACSVALLSAGPIEDLKPGCWVEIPGSRLDSCPERARQAAYSWLAEGAFGSIMSAWCGGAYDTKRDRLLVGPGGGHASYNGNEVYAFTLSDLQWHRITSPDPADGECTADSVPFAMHTYDGVEYLPNVDRYVVVGGWCTPKTYALDFATQHWENKATQPDSRTGDVSGYDPVTGHLFFVAGMQGRLLEWDPAADVWTARSESYLSWNYHHTGAIDPERRLMVIVGEGHTSTLSLEAPYTYTRLATTGDTGIESGNSVGVEYDPILDRMVCWMSGTDVYILDLDTRVWLRQIASGANTVDPGIPNQNGTFGRFRYVPSQNAYILVNTHDRNVNFFKLTSWADTLPLASLEVHAEDTTFELYLWTDLTVIANRSGGSRDTVSSSCVYASLDTGIASVNSYRVTGKAVGSARIQVTKSTSLGVFLDTIVLQVVPSTAVLDSITISPPSARVLASTPYGLVTTGYFHKLGKQFTRIIDTVASWTSGDDDIAWVSRGVVTGVAAGGPVSIIASMDGKADTALFTVSAKPSFVMRVNFQVTDIPWSYGWLANNGTAYSAQAGCGWISPAGFTLRDDRGGANFLLKSFTGTSRRETFQVDLPDGEYVIKAALGDNQYGGDDTVWYGGQIIQTHSGSSNGIAVETLTVSGGAGLSLVINGKPDYLVVISSQGIDINDVAWDDGTVTPIPPTGTPVMPPPAEQTLSLDVYPNPFNPAVTIVFNGSGFPDEAGIFSLQGRKMADIRGLFLNNRAVWRPALPSGIYVVRITAGERVLSRRLILMK